MSMLTPEDRARLRDLAAKATPGPWEVNLDGDLQGRRPGRMVYLEMDPMVGVLERDEDTAYVAAADPATVTALLDALDEARADLAAIRARDDEVCADEGWWIGGAWGDYGEVVVPLRILSYVVGGELDQKVADIDPGFALTYAEQVARAERAEAAVQRLRDLHAPRVEEAIVGACADEECDHDGPCPGSPFTVCAECWRIAEASDPYFSERGIHAVLYPCPTVRALDGDA